VEVQEERNDRGGPTVATAEQVSTSNTSNAGPVAAGAFDLDHMVILGANDRAEHLLGAERGSLEGVVLKQILHRTGRRYGRRCGS
jgi:hypothetical protein